MHYEVLAPMLTPSLLKKPGNASSKQAVGTGIKLDPTEKIRSDVNSHVTRWFSTTKREKFYM